MVRIKHVIDTYSDDDHGHLLTAACRAAITAGNILKSLLPQARTITKKGKTDLVTEADLAAEKAIIDCLQKDTPDIPILAEESGFSHHSPQKDDVWIVDPLDGTTNYAHGFPFFCVSIALLRKDKPLVSAIYAPLFDELFYGYAGKGAWLNNSPMNVTQTDILIESLVATGFPYETERFLPELIKQLENILPKVRDIRRAGAAALDLAYVSCGRLDGFYERDLKPWDTSAGWLLVKEAGGKVTNFNNDPFSPFVPEIIASNGKIHQQLVGVLA